MANWNSDNATITNKGLALLAKVTEGTVLSLLRAVAGSGYVDPGTLQEQTEVTDVKQELSFSTQSYPEERKCAVPIRLVNTGLTTGYNARQIGLYAFDPDDGEILFLIAQSEDQAGTEVKPESEMPGFSVSWEFFIEYGSADGVTVAVDPSNTVTVQEAQNMVENHNKDTNPHAGVLVSKGTFEAHTGATGNVHGLTKEDLGLDKVDNTTDASKHVAFASSANEAAKVKYNIIIRLKGGRTEGTDQFTFDGSVTKSINITAAKIGAAAEGHAHTAEDLKDMLASGPMVLSSNQYGTELPATGVAGQIFFLKV